MALGDFSWRKMKFLESADNLKALIKENVGREPSSRVAREITSCLQQGRLFFEAAESSPLEIKPLQLFYGMVGFAKAVVLGRSVKSLGTLSPSHGLSDISEQNCELQNLALKIGNRGTFQEFNDTVSSLNRICYWAESYAPVSTPLPTTPSHQLVNLKLTLREILSRIPDLEDLYRMTFREHANACSSQNLLISWYSHDEVQIRITDNAILQDRHSLSDMLIKWKTRYSFLDKWFFVSATRKYGASFLDFRNLERRGIDEVADGCLEQAEEGFQVRLAILAQIKAVEFTDLLSPSVVGFISSPSMISPVGEIYLSEFSLHYLGMYLLSSLVRYRPDTWAHALSRTATSERAADDKGLALIETFLRIVESNFPAMVLIALNPYEDRHRQVRHSNPLDSPKAG